MLKCTRCQEEKPGTTQFFPPHKNKANGLDSWCRECRNSYRREIRRGHYRSMIDDSSLKSIISSTIMCTICGDKESLVVDHDHKFNKIRGIICNRCNKGLGLFRDNPEFLEYARIYLLAANDDPEAIGYVKEHSGLNLCERIQ